MQRDEFFWISEINKASVVANSRSGLLEPTLAKEAAGGIKALDAAAEADPAKRVKRYIDYEPMLIAATGPEVTMLHAGRSSQDILSTVRVAIDRQDLFAVAKALDVVIENF